MNNANQPTSVGKNSNNSGESKKVLFLELIRVMFSCRASLLLGLGCRDRIAAIYWAVIKLSRQRKVLILICYTAVVSRNLWPRAAQVNAHTALNIYSSFI